jgi:hypothetical protein
VSQQKHRVVVEQGQLLDYIHKGYEKIDVPAVELLGAASWALLDAETRKGLVVVEIDAALHREMNTPEVRYTVILRTSYRRSSASTMKLDVLETNPEDWTTVCAPSDLPQAEVHPAQYETKRLGKTAREAVEIAKPDILEAIRDLRADADRLEAFLKRHEVL